MLGKIREEDIHSLFAIVTSTSTWHNTVIPETEDIRKFTVFEPANDTNWHIIFIDRRYFSLLFEFVFDKSITLVTFPRFSLYRWHFPNIVQFRISTEKRLIFWDNQCMQCNHKDLLLFIQKLSKITPCV